MHAIHSRNVSEAWVNALSSLVESQGKAVHLAVAIQYPIEAENTKVRAVLDEFISDRREADGGLWPVSTVANTLFPSAFYQRHQPDARPRLYRLHAKAQQMHERMRESENYFNRLVAYPTADGEPFNQLEYVVDRLVNQRKPRKGGRGGPLSSAYEIGFTLPDGGDLRIQAPGYDRNTMGFPCLSHISFTLHQNHLNLAALYRNQHFVARAYGNYLGLTRLADFVAHEIDVELGEILCVATHADAQFSDFGKTRVQRLAQSARAALTDSDEALTA